MSANSIACSWCGIIICANLVSAPLNPSLDAPLDEQAGASAASTAIPSSSFFDMGLLFNAVNSG
jgi:hypothetical protein